MKFNQWTRIFRNQFTDALIRFDGSFFVLKVILLNSCSTEQGFGQIFWTFGEAHAAIVDFEKFIKAAFALKNAFQCTKCTDVFGIICQ